MVMALPNAYVNYNNSKVLTASPAQLTLMLYEGAIKFCNIARMAIEEKNYERANTNIKKAEKIIAQLRVTLDFKYPVAKDFDQVYVIISDRLFRANIGKDIELLDQGIKYIRTMKETWEEVMRLAKVRDRA